MSLAAQSDAEYTQTRRWLPPDASDAVTTVANGFTRLLALSRPACAAAAAVDDYYDENATRVARQRMADRRGRDQRGGGGRMRACVNRIHTLCHNHQHQCSRSKDRPLKWLQCTCTSDSAGSGFYAANGTYDVLVVYPLVSPLSRPDHGLPAAFPVGTTPLLGSGRLFASLRESKMHWQQYLQAVGLGSSLPVTLQAWSTRPLTHPHPFHPPSTRVRGPVPSTSSATYGILYITSNCLAGRSSVRQVRIAPCCLALRLGATHCRAPPSWRRLSRGNDIS